MAVPHTHTHNKNEIPLWSSNSAFEYIPPNGFPSGTVVKNLPANAEDVGWIPQSGRSPGVGNCNVLQYSRLENSMGRGAWHVTVHGSQSDTTERIHTPKPWKQGLKEMFAHPQEKQHYSQETEATQVSPSAASIKTCYTHTVEYYLALNKEGLPLWLTW